VRVKIGKNGDIVEEGLSNTGYKMDIGYNWRLLGGHINQLLN
jgi:hypothetical protein